MSICSVRIWFANLRLDKLSGNLSSSLLVQLGKELKNYFSSNPSYKTNPRVAIERWLQSNTEKFCLSGLRKPATINGDLSCIVDAAAFGRYNLDCIELLGYETDENDGKRVFEALKNRLIESEHFKGDMRTTKPIFWCTLSSELTYLIKEADKIRDKLGLKNIFNDIYLLRINIPFSKVNGKKFSAPTALDGGCNEVFTSCAQTDGYGRTLDLSNYRSGVKELVVEKLPFDKEYQVFPIGKTCDMPPILNKDILYHHLRQRRSLIIRNKTVI